jgi:hypothetical protein
MSKYRSVLLHPHREYGIYFTILLAYLRTSSMSIRVDFNQSKLTRSNVTRFLIKGHLSRSLSFILPLSTYFLIMLSRSSNAVLHSSAMSLVVVSVWALHSLTNSSSSKQEPSCCSTDNKSETSDETLEHY